MSKRLLLTILLLLFSFSPLHAAKKGKEGKTGPKVFDGYAGMPWGTDMHQVLRNYPGVVPEQVGSDVVLRQKNPNREMGQRAFIFRDNKLVAVTIKFNASYVKKTGSEKLLEIHKQYYGPGILDRSSSAHMLSHIWETPKTRITYAYSPKYPDMTAVLFQKKEKPASAKAAPAPTQQPPASATPALPPGHPPINGSKPVPAAPLNLPKGHPPIPGQTPPQK